jgi:hypothetical protein
MEPSDLPVTGDSRFLAFAAPRLEPEPDEEELVDESLYAAADANAVAMGPPNLRRYLRGRWIAGCEVEYLVSQWTQDYEVTLDRKAGIWTVFDIRVSGDREGSMGSDFRDLASAADYIAGEIEDHGDHVPAGTLKVRSLSPDDHVELRRLVARLRVRMRNQELGE